MTRDYALLVTFWRIRREVWTLREETLRHQLADRGENWMIA